MTGMICSDRWSLTSKVADTFFPAVKFRNDCATIEGPAHLLDCDNVGGDTSSQFNAGLESVGGVKCATQEKNVDSDSTMRADGLI